MKRIKQEDKYLKILKSYSSNMYSASKKVLDEGMNKRKNQVFVTSACFTGPILYSYVSWILEEAKKKSISRLYFLARDGDILYNIALLQCKKYNIDIECRYLYCSRYALRVPEYHLNIEKAFDKLFLNGIDITLNKIMERANFTNEQKEHILVELGIDFPKLNLILSRIEINEYKKQLYKSMNFIRFIIENSKKQYDITIEYLKQEGLFDRSFYAIVDSGWTGSMQESLYHLLKSENKEIQSPYGFYFGMYNLPKEMESERYITYYFNKKTGILRKIFFNNNIFECMCASKDGMTIGFQKENEIKAIFSSEENINNHRWELETQWTTIMEFSNNMVQNDGMDLSFNNTMKMIYKLNKKFMFHPSIEEVESYGMFIFSDDITENHVQYLIEAKSRRELLEELIIVRIVKKILGIPSKIKENSWNEGSIIKNSMFLRPLFQFNLLIIKGVRYIKMSL